MSNDEGEIANVQDHQAPDKQPSLEHLMELYEQADSEATVQLIKALSRTLYRFLASQLGNRSEAEDPLQEVLLKLHKARHTYQRGQAVLPFVFAIARHVRVDDYRKRCRTSMRETTLKDVPEPISDPVSLRSGIPDFKTLIAELPDSQREVVIMLKINGLSLEEIARATSSSVGAVKQKARRAYQRLRLLLAQSAVGAGSRSGNGL